MCGICFWLQFSHATEFKPYYEKALQLIARRGSDYQGFHDIRVNGTSKTMNFHGCVLHLRGEKLGCQPAIDANGNVLLWNGEIFGGLEVEETESDTMSLLNYLQASGAAVKDILNAFSKIDGPYAFIYYQAASNLLWFGRDIFGRRSLLVHLPINENDYFALSSVAPKCSEYEWFELPALGIFCLNLTRLNVANGGMQLTEYSQSVQLYPWHSPYRLNMIDLEVQCMQPQELAEFKDAFGRWYSIHDNLEIKNHLKPFLRQLPSDNYNADDEIYQKSLVDNFYSILSEAVRKRVCCISPDCGVHLANVDEEQNLKHSRKARIAVLYSGGIDSAIVAALADRHIPSGESIDLINVAFATKNHSGDSIFDVPDRISGREVLQELRRSNVRRQWNFIEVDISSEELQEVRKNHVKHLVHPHRTVLDDSIGCAIWFAARGRGFIRDCDKGSLLPYCSSAKVLLVGMGADEQLAGYARHRTRFMRDGWEGLVKEVEMEISRISTRNLGRDDRCISDHNREARFPYLDENVVSFLNSLPIWNKADLRLPKGVGDKLLLRQVGQSLGLHQSSKLEKKAIQFGSRIAKLEKSSEKGSQRCSRLQ